MMKYCLITGASGGIGSAISHALSKEGYTLILQGRNEEKLLNLKNTLSTDSFVLLGDLTNGEDRNKILMSAFNIGHIDLLVNCAGTSCFSPLDAMENNAVEQLINLNLTAQILFTQRFISELTHRQSHSNNAIDNKTTPLGQSTIINVGSALGFIGHPGYSIYCASKFGFRGFTESLARELSDSNIRVAFFAPRATETSFNSDEVNALNNALGNNIDPPAYVAKEFMSLLSSKRKQKVVGWPEKLFARINGAFPEIVDMAMASKLKDIKQFFKSVDNNLNNQ